MKILSNLAVAIAAILMTLLALEAGLRIFSLLTTYHNNRIFTSPPVPGLPKIVKANLHYRGFYTNSMHLRDDEIPLDKPPNTFRIAVVGNSVTAGHEVDQDELFTEILETRLNEIFSGKPRLDVINTGQLGFNINHFQKYCEAVVYRYQPDVILYQFCWNDIADPVRLRGRRFPDQVPEKGLQRFLLLHSKIYLNLYRVFYRGAFGEKLIGYYDNEELVGEFYRDLFSWAESVRARGMGFMMVIIPMALEVQATDKYPDLARKFIAKKNEIADVCLRNGIEVIDLSGPMREDFFRHRQNLYADQGHLNARGHALAARLLRPALEKVVLEGSTNAGGK